MRVVVDRHRRWLLDLFAGIAADAGATDPDVAAGQLMMLRDGAMVSGYLTDPLVVGETLRRAFASILAANAPEARAEA